MLVGDRGAKGESTREVHYYVHGRGRGHAIRALEVVPALMRAGYRVRLFAGDDALPMLQSLGRCWPIYSLRPHEPLLTGPKLLQRTLWAGTRNWRRPPCAVVSDGDLPSSAAGALARVPVIAIGHGLLFHCASAPSNLDAAAWSREGAKAARASVGSSRQVVVHFEALSLDRESARLARPPLPARRSNASARGGVLCYFRDENATPVLTMLRSLGISLRLFGRRDPQIPGVSFTPYDRDRFLEALGGADAVISSAGCQLIAECLALEVPHLALYRARDDEQQLNARLLERQGLLQGAMIEQLTRADLLHFLTRLGELRALRSQLRPLEALPALSTVVLQVLREVG